MDNTAVDYSSFLELLRIEKLFVLFFCFFILTMAVKTTKFISTILGNSFPTKRMLISQFQAILAYFLYIGGGSFLIINIISPPKEIIVAIGGSAAVAIGFSLKDLVASVVAGVILIFDRPFQVGDRVQFQEHYGDITSIGLRAIRLQTLDDSTITIPNSRFITDVVTSANMGSLDMQVETYFYFPVDTDIQQVTETLYEVASTSRFVLLSKKVVVNVIEIISENKVFLKFTVKAYIIDTRFESSYKTDLTSRSNDLIQAFRTKES